MKVHRFVSTIAAALCLSIGLAQAQEKVNLKLNLKPNESWSMSQSMDMDMNIQVNAGGNQQNVQQKMSMVLNSVTTPLEVKDGVPTKLKATFGNDCKINMTMMGQSQAIPFPLAGKTLTITKKDDGTVDIEPKDAVDQKNAGMMKEMMESSKAFYPEKPVAVGDSWTVKPEAVAKMFQLESGSKGEITCTLNGIKQLDGRKAAEVSMKGNAAGKMQGMDVTVDITGPMVVDLESGQPLSSDMQAKMTIKGAPGGAGADPNMNFSGNGTVTVKQTIKPAKI